MIHKYFEFNKIQIKKYNYYLFYGENEGLKNEIINNHFKRLFDSNIYKYDETSILQNPNDLFDKIQNKSFFENEKLIILTGITNKFTPTINEIVEKKLKDIFIILIADKLDKKSKLRLLFEENNSFVCVPFYADNFQSLFYIIDNFFKKNKIKISQEIINILINRANGNRRILNNEIKKIESFIINKKQIKQEDILKLTNMGENNTFSELADNCLAKNEKKIIDIINDNNFSTEDTIIIIRTLLAKAKRLLNINDIIKSKNNVEDALKAVKPPVFWKDVNLVKKQIKNYTSRGTQKLIDNINETELLIKKNHNNSINILLDFIISQSKEINNKIW